MTTYKTTKEQCAERITGICAQCGGEITPLETVDNAGDPTFWPGCEKCCRFDNGVDPEIYRIAKKMVVGENYYHYAHIRIEDKDSKDVRQFKIESQIGGTCGIVRDVLRIHNGG